MTAQERYVLQQMGVGLLKNLPTFTVTILIYGILTAFLSISVYTSIRRRLSGSFHSGWVMVIVTILGYLISSAYCTLYLVCLATMSSSRLSETTHERVISGVKLAKLNIMMPWVAQLLPIVNDALIVWRGRVVFVERRWVMYIVSLFWLALSATTVAELGFILNDPGGTIVDGKWLPLYTVSMALSLATNFFATSAIASMLWAHRKFLFHTLGRKQRRRSDVLRVLTVLVESGCMYCILQFITLMLNALYYSDTSAARHATSIFLSVSVVVSAMYPPLVNCLIKWTVLPTTAIGGSDSLGEWAE